MSAECAFVHVLRAAEREGCRFTHAQVSAWDHEVLATFERLGIVRRIKGVVAECPGCELGCCGRVYCVPDRSGRERRHIACPLHGRVEVSDESCAEWVVDRAAVVAEVARELGTAGVPRAVDRGIWKLGRCKFGASSREVIFLIDSGASAERAVAAHVGHLGRAVVVVPARVPDERVWHGAIPAVVTLCDGATFTPRGFEIDSGYVLDQIERADAATARASLLPADRRIKREVLAQQVHEAIKNASDDDLCVATYKQIPSYRRAAEHLTATFKRRFTKEDIARAVRRAGGPNAVTATEDSSSVGRSVASRSRDRGEKFERYRN